MVNKNTGDAQSENHTLVFHSVHPRVGTPTRASYTIPGRPGNVVIFLSLFADGVAPQTLELPGVNLITPTQKPDASSKAEAQAQKLAERAEKAKAKIEEQKKKAEERAAKAQEKLDAARKKVEGAQVSSATATQ